VYYPSWGSFKDKLANFSATLTGESGYCLEKPLSGSEIISDSEMSKSTKARKK
jgi:hypothetical protein